MPKNILSEKPPLSENSSVGVKTQLWSDSKHLPVITLVVAIILAYANSLRNGFTLDDFLYIFNNPAVTSPSWKALFSATKDFNVFRPVTFASFAFNWALGGAHAWGYHLLNLLLHVAVVLLVYFLLSRLLTGIADGNTLAWIAALLFAVHPIHTEAVSSVVGRSELLATEFVLAAWLFHLSDRPALSLVCFVAAMLSKESAIVFVPLVFLGDYVLRSLKPWWRYGSIVAAAAVYTGILWTAQGGRFGEKGVTFLDNPLANIPVHLRILNATRIAWKYLALQAYPAVLSCDYSYNAITLYSAWRHLWLPALALFLLIALWVWAVLTHRTLWALAGTFYFAGFAVTANFLIPTGTIMGERLLYLPSIGFCFFVALLLSVVLKRLPTAGWSVLVILVCLLAIRTVIRNRDWRDNFALFSSAVRVVPESAKARAGLAGEYLSRNMLEQARQEFQRSLQIYPDYVAAINSFGIVESRLDHNKEALALMQRSVAMTRKDDANYDFEAVTLAAQLMKMGKSDEALNVLNDEISASPRYSRAWSNRAVIHFWRGQIPQARSDAEVAIQLDPANIQALGVLDSLLKYAPASKAQE